MAILLACASPEIEVIGIVAAAGNVPLHRTALNARKILELAGRNDVPVHAGCPRPMARALVTAEQVHGVTGLDGPHFPDPVMPLQDMHGVDWLIETLSKAAPDSITMCILGPMTNLAMSLVKAPEIAHAIDKVVAMGGAYFEVGNITPAAEFNIYVDPEAAEIVLKSGIPVVLAPLDLTHKVLVTKERFNRIEAVGNKASHAVVQMLTFSEQFDRKKYGWDGAPLHDPCVIAYLLKPELFTGRTINVEVETNSELTRGMTVADWWRVTDRAPNCLFLGDADIEGFFDLLVERLSFYSGPPNASTD